MNSLARAVLGAVLVVVAGCSAWLARPEASFSCAQWMDTSAGSRTELATLIVDSENILESVRIAQRREPGTPKASLIQDVSASITKNCEVMDAPDHPVTAIAMELYGGGREYDGIPGASAP